MVHLQPKKLTLEEFLKLPETEPASEYINGQIFQKPMPQGKHSKLQGKLVTAINQIVEEQKIALAFPELRCTFGDRSIVSDVAVFAWDRIPVDERGDVANVFRAAPDWTIEILSPDGRHKPPNSIRGTRPHQSQTRVTGNILHCLKHGSQLGWLIDPDERSVIVYWAEKPPELLQEPADKLPVPELVAGLQLTVGDLFGWLKI